MDGTDCTDSDWEIAEEISWSEAERLCEMRVCEPGQEAEENKRVCEMLQLLQALSANKVWRSRGWFWSEAVVGGLIYIIYIDHSASVSKPIESTSTDM